MDGLRKILLSFGRRSNSFVDSGFVQEFHENFT